MKRKPGPARASKQAFEHEAGQLFDRSEEGRAAVFEAPLFRRRRAPSRRAAKPADVDSLLAGLDADQWSATDALVARRGEPDVARRLTEYALRTTVPSSASCRLLGALGGADGRAALSRALGVLLDSPPTFEKSKDSSGAAQRAASIAEALLRLDRDALDAAEGLARLFDHPHPYNRMWAVWMGAGVYAESPRLGTRAMDRLADALRPLVRDRDAKVFIKAIPALFSLGEPESRDTRRRCRRLLRGSDAWLREDTVELVLRCEAPDLEILAEWFQGEPLARLRVGFATRFASLMAPDTLEALARESLADVSPSLRYEALRLVSYLDRRRQRALLKGAIADEPDPELRAEMDRTLKLTSRPSPRGPVAVAFARHAR